MAFLESQKKSLYRLCCLLGLFMGMSGILQYFKKAPLEPWSRSFFEQIALKEDPSCRIYQIWVFPFQDGRSIGPIGGKHFEDWKKAVEDLCEEAKREPRVRFVYELYVDRHVMGANIPLRAEWEQRYGESIRWKQIERFEEIPAAAEKMTQLQCASGCAAVCSDWVRVWELYRPEYTYNIYIDIDTLSQFSKSKGKIMSSEALGGVFDKPGVYCTYHVSGASANPNNDVLVAYRLDKASYEELRSDLLASILSYEPVFEHMGTQHIRLQKESFEEYGKSLERLMDWASDEDFPSRNINQYGVLLEQSGPSFWSNQIAKGQALPNRYSYLEGLVNDYSWHEQSQRLPYSEYSIESLSACYDMETARSLMWINLYLYDYRPVELREKSWKGELEKECFRLWSLLELPPQARQAEERLGERLEKIQQKQKQ